MLMRDERALICREREREGERERGRGRERERQTECDSSDSPVVVAVLWSAVGGQSVGVCIIPTSSNSSSPGRTDTATDRK